MYTGGSGSVKARRLSQLVTEVDSCSESPLPFPPAFLKNAVQLSSDLNTRQGQRVSLYRPGPQKHLP